MKLHELDAKYMTAGDLLRSLARLMERCGVDARTNITELKMDECPASKRVLIARTGDLADDIRRHRSS